jgi:hypothetical protein
VKKLGYTGAEVARFLAVTASAVNHVAASRNPRVLRGPFKLSPEPTLPTNG